MAVLCRSPPDPRSQQQALLMYWSHTTVTHHHHHVDVVTRQNGCMQSLHCSHPMPPFHATMHEACMHASHGPIVPLDTVPHAHAAHARGLVPESMHVAPYCCPQCPTIEPTNPRPAPSHQALHSIPPNVMTCYIIMAPAPDSYSSCLNQCTLSPTVSTYTARPNVSIELTWPLQTPGG